MKRQTISLCTAIALATLPFVPPGGSSPALAHPPARSAATSAPAGQKELPILHKWSGDFPLADLQRLPTDQRNAGTGFIGDPLTFASVWEAFKPGEALPSVDFSSQLVIFSRNTQFYNRMSIVRVTIEKGVAEPLVMETRSALPLEDKAAMALAVVPRAGVLSIRGNASAVPSIQSADNASSDTTGRFIGEYRLEGGMTAVVAEGDREPRSVGSYSVRIYADPLSGSYVAGTIRPRDGFIREVRIEGRDRSGRDKIVVVVETAGSGRYASRDVFLFDGRNIIMGEQAPGRHK